MKLTFVTPAWRRFAVTRLALAQRRRLCDELSSRGVTTDCVIIADDENLDIAEEFGFSTVNMKNECLGDKVNRGFRWAYANGADYISFVGSDNWIHIDLFGERLIAEMKREKPVVSGKYLCHYELETGLSKVVTTRSPYGMIPWLIPRKAFEPEGEFISLVPSTRRGIDLALGNAIAHLPWVYRDPHALTRVDFKSDVGMTPFGAGTAVAAAPPLSSIYPPDLVDMVMDHRMVTA